MPEDALLSDDSNEVPVSVPSASPSPVQDDPVSSDDFEFLNGGDSKPVEGGDPSSPAPSPATTPASAPQAYAPSDYYLTDKARQYGLNPEDYGSDKALRAAVTREDQHRQAWANYHAQQQQRQQTPQQRQQVPQPTQWNNPLKNNPDIDPALVQTIDELQKYNNQVLAYSLQGQQAAMQQQYQILQGVTNKLAADAARERQREERAAMDLADSVISALPNEYEQYVGKGSDKGDARDPEVVAVRNDIISRAAFLASRDQVDWGTMTKSQWNGYVKEAADSKFGSQLKSLAHNSIIEAGRQRQSTFQPRGASEGRRAKPRVEDANAMDFLDKFSAVS
jgi:hypothetical protein